MIYIRDYFTFKSNKGNVLAMILIRGLSMLISFFYVPLLLNALDVDSYAIWLTLTSIVSWVVMFDIGIGNGLRNKLSEALSLNKLETAKSYISTAYGAIIVGGLMLIIIFSIIFPYINWSKLLNATSLPIQEVNLLVIIVGLSFIINFQLGLINSILLALKLPAKSSLIGLIGQLVSYVTVWIIVKLINISSLLWICAIVSFIPALVLFISTLFIFGGKYKTLKPSIHSFDKEKLYDIFSLGLKFFWLQIITIVLFQTNNLIITHTVGNSGVVEYNICYKYFYSVVTVFTIICTPFWSSTTYAYARGDMQWIKRIRQKLTIIAMAFTIIGIVMIMLASPIYNLWIGDECPNIPLIDNILMASYCVLLIFYSSNGYILNGIGKLVVQTIVTSALAVIYLPMAIIGGRYLGLVGVLVALVFNAAVNTCWSKIQLDKILNNTARGIWFK